ncbi:DUF2259 domain-containing protein [Planktothrix sp. FACHB-1355]|uniref:DUF2259 domain-containing protein n=1 Tax=Aerosakkonema funiforme FACHB-1375 TaxID=2949571 RepID=A0A926ZG14_9CYAN|nr:MULTISPECIES: DUF2259 domain-containing protein [Oscillatoriales]MBD2180652.1 DUF2259 domain-containing protein [Aerosakkonema funiforme FACHB-1375]MBD3561046.1 DUF2259 domain-containing protein [Planktothrix sp. FACHB-1355]
MKSFYLVSLGLAASLTAVMSAEVWADVWRTTQRMAGFSTDSLSYIYLESSRDTGAGIPKAEMQIVNVPSNSCVPNGCIETQYGESQSGKTTKMAEDDLLARTGNLRRRLKLVSPHLGTKLNIISRSNSPDGSETVVARLNNGKTLQIRLEQKQIKSTSQGGTAERDKASMSLLITYNNRQRRIGSLNNYRDWVISYSLREVRLSPNGRNAIVLLDKTEPTFEGVLQTTLVQGFPL